MQLESVFPDECTKSINYEKLKVITMHMYIEKALSI